MFALHQIPNTNVLEFTIDGALTREDFDAVAAQLEQIIEKHGKVKILEIVRNIGKIEPSALWTDIKWAPKHLKNFTHAAVVADQKWIEWMAAVLRPFFSMEIRFFHSNELGDARQWLLEQK